MAPVKEKAGCLHAILIIFVFALLSNHDGPVVLLVPIGLVFAWIIKSIWETRAEITADSKDTTANRVLYDASYRAHMSYSLFLRSFKTDRRLFVASHPPMDLLDGLQRFNLGTNITVKTDEPYRFMYGGQISLTEENWKSYILSLVDDASLIIIIPLEGKSIAWEICSVIERGIEKSIFVMPGAWQCTTFRYKNHKGKPRVRHYAEIDRDLAQSLSREWGAVVKTFKEHGLEAPAYQEAGALFWYVKGDIRLTPLPTGRLEWMRATYSQSRCPKRIRPNDNLALG